MTDTLETTTAPRPNFDLPPRFIHIFEDADGVSHMQELDIAIDAGPAPVVSLVARTYAPSKVDWHVAPARQFVLNLSGELEAEVADGTRRRIGPGELVYLEDVAGKGHVTRLLGPVTCIFMRVDDGFDAVAWARAGGA